MVEISDIKDQKTFKTWLDQENLPHKTLIALAHRAAMRAAPAYWRRSQPVTDKFDLTALPVQRSCLISGVASKMPTPEIIRAAARAAARASAARAAARASVASAYPARAAAWAATRADCALVSDMPALLAAPLWPKENPLAAEWSKIRTAWRNAGPNWQFWITWYDDALTGKHRTDADWALLEKFALIDREEWNKGQDHVNALIAEILDATPNFPTRLPVKTIEQAIDQNRDAFPAQFDALIELIEAEIERIRGKNPQSDLEAEDLQRLKKIFENMHGSIKALASQTGQLEKPSEDDVEEVAGTLSVYLSEFQKWPRENAAEIVDSSCRVVLVGATAGLLATFGLPALAGVAAGSVMFGGKKLADLRKAASDIGGQAGS